MPDHALAALGLAERIWMGLGEEQLRAQTFVDIGHIAASTGEVAAARVAALGALAADPAPLAEPADPTDTRRVRRAMQAAWMFNMASGMADQHGMSLASTALLETLEPLRIGLPGYRGRGLVFATNLLTLLDLPGMRIASVLYRVRVALEEGDTDRTAELFIEARAVLDMLPATERDHSEALLKAYEGDFPGASAAFDKYVQPMLSAADTTGSGLSEVRMLHVQGMGFQLNVENPLRARFHYEALAATADPWWSGLGPGWRNLGLLARLLEQEGDFLAALAAADEALAEIEAVRATLRRDDVRRSFFASADVQHVYFDATLIALGLAEHALANDDRETVRRGHAAAFDYAERARARALLDLMLGDRGVEHAGLPTGLVTRWRAASAEVAPAQARLAAADQRGEQTVGDLSAGLDGAVSGLRAVEDELRSIAPRFSAVVNPQAEVSDLDAVADALPDGAILVQYAIRRTDLLAWAISRHGVVARHRMTGEHGIAHLVSSVVDSCAHGTEYEAPARRLADLLLEPLRVAVEGAASLLIVPSGPTLRLPFGVLPWDSAPLAEKFPLTLLPSASALRAVREPNRGDGEPLIVGDPAGMEFTEAPGESPIPAPALPGSRLEAAYVARLLPGSTLLLGEEATRTAVLGLLPGAAVAHFATHGVLDADSPLASAILLASGQSLTAAELVGQRIGADLIVLSACHTGTGELVRGDELLGLGRALLAAGARSVVVSLWAVDDLSAALLMAEFYRRRSAGSSDRDALMLACRHVRSLDRDRALAACAQLRAADPGLADALEQPTRTLGTWPSKSTPYAHPRHWAPFVLISVQ
jgi:CHAT domain-containing protein